MGQYPNSPAPKNLLSPLAELSTKTLADIQKEAAEYPEVITSKKEFDNVYEGYQYLRKFRIAIVNKTKELNSEEKQVFEDKKNKNIYEQDRILTIIVPIERTLLATREVWEEKEGARKHAESLELARIQQKEFERQEKIRIKQEIADIWDVAKYMNMQHDKKIQDALDFEAEKVEFAKKKLELEERERELELQEKERVRASQERVNKLLEPLESKLIKFDEDKKKIYDQAWIDAHEEKYRRGISEIDKDISDAIGIPVEVAQNAAENIEGNTNIDELVNQLCEPDNDPEPFKFATVQLRYSLDIECPHCKKKYDLCDQDDDGQYSTPIFNNKWDDIQGHETYCDHCNKTVVIKKVEY